MQPWTQVYPLAPGATLRIEGQVGPISVVGVSGTEAKVTAIGPNADEALEIRHRERELRLEVVSDEGLELQVAVPHGTACFIEAASGAVVVEGTGAEVRVETGDGPVRITGAAEDVKVETGNGPVQVRNVYGRVRAEVGEGDVHLEQVDGAVTVDLGSGQALLRRVRGGAVDVSVGEGQAQLKELDVAELTADLGECRVEVELLRVHPGGKYAITTGSEEAVVALPPDADLKLQVVALSDGIRREGLPMQVKEERRGELSAVMGQGSARLTVEAGGVRLVPCVAPAVAVPDGDGDQLSRIVTMVAEGKLTPAEAEQLLLALDGEESA